MSALSESLVEVGDELNAAFNRATSDTFGLLNARGLKQILLQLGLAVDEQYADLLVRRYDPGRKGALDSDEFRYLFFVFFL